VLLLGPSGAGKSTLLAALGGLHAEDSGEQEGTIAVDGAPPRHRAATAMLFQDPEAQIVMARTGDDVAFGLENIGVPAAEIWPRVVAAMRAVGFPYGREHRTDALSGGEQQRLALAGAIAAGPDLLLLDEPTANLDPASAAVVRESVGRALAESDATLVLVEHRVADWLPLIDRVVVLTAGGGVIADGPPVVVFGTRGEELAAAGVWVPGLPGGSTRSLADVIVPRPPASHPAGDLLLAGEGLGFTHPGASRPALSTVDIEVRANRALAVTGPSGSGKSTLALLLGGLLAPTQGSVRATRRLAGASDAEKPPHRWRAPKLATRIGSVFQNPEHQFLTGRVRHELALGPTGAGRTDADVMSTVDGLLSKLHLDHLADANPYTLSGGEQRRLSVATALAAAPTVLVLDEPTFGQDRRTWTELLLLLGRLRDEGCAVVTVTHDTDLVNALADATVVLDAGRALDTAVRT